MTTEKTQVLLLHGFTGSSADMVGLSSELLKKGMRVSVPSLPGHDTHIRELETIRYEEWIAGAQKALDLLDGEGPRIVVALSMGTFIATVLAAKPSNKIAGLVLLAPAFELQGTGRLGIVLSQWGLHWLRRFIEKKNGSDILDPKARKENKAYDHIPVRGLVQFEKLRKLALQKIKEVSCPVFLGFGAQDHTVDNEKSALQLAKLSSPRIERHDYPNSAHVVTVDYDHQTLNADVIRFIESL